MLLEDIQLAPTRRRTLCKALLRRGYSNYIGSTSTQFRGAEGAAMRRLPPLRRSTILASPRSVHLGIPRAFAVQ
jgi:hypothetical protein